MEIAVGMSRYWSNSKPTGTREDAGGKGQRIRVPVPIPNQGGGGRVDSVIRKEPVNPPSARVNSIVEPAGQDFLRAEDRVGQSILGVP